RRRVRPGRRRSRRRHWSRPRRRSADVRDRAGDRGDAGGDRGSGARPRLLPRRPRGSVLRLEPADRGRRRSHGDTVDRVDPLEGGERAPRRGDGDRRRGRSARRLGSVHTRRPSAGSGRVTDLAPWTQLDPRERIVVREDVKAYADASGDQNPLHQDDAFARSVGFPGVIAHGMFTMAHLTKAITDWLGDPAALTSIHVQFRAVVFMDETLVAGGRVTELDPST